MFDFSIFDRISPPTTYKETLKDSWLIIYGMPRIDNMLIDSVIYIYPSEEAAEKDDGVYGTGFLLSVPLDKNSGYVMIYAVTNKHLINAISNNGKSSKVSMRISTHIEDVGVFTNPASEWESHSTSDVSVIPIARCPKNNEYRCIPVNTLITKKFVKDFDIGVGDDVYMAGRLTSKKEEGGIFPTLRKGIISSNHIEILKVSEVEHPQESFIVDCHSTNGYSGAPVLLVIDPSYQRPNKPNFDNIDENSDAIHDDFMKLHSRILGINWGHLPVREKIVKKTFWGFKEFIRPVNSGIMGVIPAWKIQELLNSMKQKKIRKDHDNELTKILQSGEGIAD